MRLPVLLLAGLVFLSAVEASAGSIPIPKAACGYCGARVEENQPHAPTCQYAPKTSDEDKSRQEEELLRRQMEQENLQQLNDLNQQQQQRLRDDAAERKRIQDEAFRQQQQLEEERRKQGELEEKLRKEAEALKSSGGWSEEAGTGGALPGGGTSFFGTKEYDGSGTPFDQEPINDPKVVDLRHLRGATFFVQPIEEASYDETQLLLDEAMGAANGSPSSLAKVPPGAVMPEIDSSGLMAFQLANGHYSRNRENAAKAREEYLEASGRLEFARATARKRRDEVDRFHPAGDDMSREKRRKALNAIEAELMAERKKWDEAKERLAAAEKRDRDAREEAIRVLRALAQGKDPAGFHPPVASLPGLTEEAWRKILAAAAEERRAQELRQAKLLDELASFVPPPRGGAGKVVQEGYVQGTFTGPETAWMLEKTGESPFAGKSFRQMNEEAEEARKEGKDLGGVKAYSFGFAEQDKKLSAAIKDGLRALGDSLSAGEVSLLTPQGKKLIEEMAGTNYTRLNAHSNAASVVEALIRKDVITVNELNIMGGDRSLHSGPILQGLMDSGKVKRVVVWVHEDDPIPSGSMVLNSMNLTEKASLAAASVKNLVNEKLLGNTAAGEKCVEYRQCYNTWGAGGAFGAHDFEATYLDCVKNGTWRSMSSCR